MGVRPDGWYVMLNGGVPAFVGRTHKAASWRAVYLPDATRFDTEAEAKRYAEVFSGTVKTEAELVAMALTEE